MRITTLLSAVVVAAVGLIGAPEVANAQASAVPQGSFSQTCTVPYVVGGRLYANCRNMQGATVRSSIPLSSCSSVDVANINGMLTCGGTTGQVVAPVRPPTPVFSVTVYYVSNYRAPSQTFTTAQSSFFATTWSRTISSMRLTGVWQACTEQNFRGRCRNFTGEVSNLRDVDFDDAIMSIRPVR